jgi:hypothetical protein
MDDYTYLQWLQALATGGPVPGEYVPGTNPLDVMTGR